MTVHLDREAATACVATCASFIDALVSVQYLDWQARQESAPGAFDTARQISTVYSLFVGEDLRTVVNGFLDQAKAMSILFAAAGGLIEAQDESVAAALGKAAQEPAGLQSLGLMGSLGGMTALLDAADGLSSTGGYDRVGPEDVSGAPLARMIAGAQALDPGQFTDVSSRIGPMATGLRSAASALQSELSGVLGTQWQGEFASQAGASVAAFTRSVGEFATVLDQVAGKANGAEDGFRTTRDLIEKESASLRAAHLNQPGFGPVLGPPTADSAIAMASAQAAAEEQARATVNTVYSPAVMDANLADLDIPAPYRVVAPSALGGANGVDLASVWNVDGVVRPAGPGTASAAVIAAAAGAEDAGTDGVAVGRGAGPGAATATLPIAPTDAATQQALLSSRGGAGDGGASLTGAAGQNSTGATAPGGVNASTHAASTPFAPVPGAGQAAGNGGSATGTRGIRNGSPQRDRGFGSAAGTLAGGGAAGAGAGAGAARMGGAGTLAGLGSLGGPGAGIPGASGGPGPGGVPAGSGAAGGPAGAFSSSSTGGAQAGRAGMVPMGMMGAGAGAGAGQAGDRRGHTPAGYLTNSTNASAIVGDPVKVTPAVLGRKAVDEPVAEQDPELVARARVIGRDYTGGGTARG